MSVASAAESLLERLESLIKQSNDVVAPDLSRAVEAVRDKYGVGPSAWASPERVRLAVRRFVEEGAASLSRRDRYLLAHSLSQSLPGVVKNTIIEESHLIHPLLSRWEAEAAELTLRPSHWRGLFHSVLQSPSSPGTERLKQLLRNSLPTVVSAKRITPPWLETAKRHQHLLAHDPCRPYVTEFLSGRRTEFDDLIATFRPSSASWYWPTLAQALANAARDLADDPFTDLLQFFLKLASDISGQRDLILAALLDRYAATRDRTLHAALLAYALDAWKSPQLARHDAYWRLVRPATKQMVCGWLAQEDLEDFYRLCQDEKRVDDRRLKFWLRFRDQIVYSQIALGSALERSRDADVRRFRERKRGRLASLVRGTPTNNAILMQIGNHFFVEFSESGNACYAYSLRNRPFDAGQPGYVLARLKSAARGERLIHRGDWETEIFDPALRKRGIHPDSYTYRGAAARTGQAPAPQPIRPEPSAPSLNAPFAELPSSLHSAIVNAGARIDDRRRKGGCLWVIPRRGDQALATLLERHGFNHKEGKGYYLP